MDYTGKTGVGKRYLDETTGSLIPITSLPKSQQEEIRKASRDVQKKSNEERLAKTNAAKGISPRVDVENNDRLMDIIEKQAVVIDRLESKLDNKAVEVVKAEEVVETEPAYKPTPKELLIYEAEGLGIAVDDRMTMKQLKAAIEEETMEVVEEVEEEDEDNDL